jgi:flagellar biosynthesis/type III secretory pathway ATPase
LARNGNLRAIFARHAGSLVPKYRPLYGHFILSRELAAQGHYPAIDILHSVSRLISAIAAPAQKIRSALSAYHAAEDLIQLGAYVAGSNPELDRSIQVRLELIHFLRQDHLASTPLPETLRTLDRLAKKLEAEMPAHASVRK